MRKESLKKNSTNGVVEDTSIDNDQDINGGAAVDADDADPLQGADQPALEVPKKKGRKKNETVTEVPVPVANNDDDGSYEVEDIIDHKIEKKVRHFLVRWKNCGPSDDTWEPESSLDCPDIVQKYLDKNPDAEQSAGTSRKRSAAKEKSSDVPAKRSRAKNATTGDDNDSDDAANGDEEYEVEDIVDHKIARGKTSFLIRWKNYDASGDTWEPESSLSCPEIIARYKEEHMKDVEFKPKREKSTKPKKDKSEKEYEVQLIYDEKMQDGVKHYLVRWKGYKVDDDTWEPEHSLNCPDLIVKFQESKKNKRTSGVRGTQKKLTYTEVDETEGEDDKIYVNGSSSKKSKSKAKSAPAKGKKGAAKSKSTKTAAKDEDYEVENIVGEKMENGKKYYYLKWKGWPSSDNTWELASSLNCPDVLKNYQSKQKSSLESPKSPAKGAKSKSGKNSKKSASKTKSPAKKSKTSSKPIKSKPATKAAKKQVIDEAEQDWEVEKIIDVQYNEDGTKNFLIRWKGCDSSQDTWEPEDNVNSPDLIEAFMSQTDASDEVPKKKSRKA